MKPLARSAIVLIPLLALGVFGVLIERATDGSGGGGGARPAATTPTTQAPAPGTTPTSYAALTYDAQEVQEPTRNTGQSKLWFHDTSWWGVLLDAGSAELRIHRLDPTTQTWQDTGTLVDDRRYARADVLSDGATVHIVSSGAEEDRSSHNVLVTRFTYTAETKSYALDPRYPVALTDGGVAELALAMDGTGQLWTTFVRAGRIFASHAPGDGDAWVSPFELPSIAGPVQADQAALVAFGNRIGVLWINLGENAVYFSVHDDGAPDTSWETVRTAVDGLIGDQDDLALQAFDSEARVFAAVQTSLGSQPNANELAPKLLLLELLPDLQWRQHLFGRVNDHHSNPALLIDREERSLYMFATAPGQGGAVYYKKTSVDSPSFATGTGTPLIAPPFGTTTVDQATSTKQELDRASGLVVLASDDTTGRYFHAVLDLAIEATG